MSWLPRLTIVGLLPFFYLLMPTSAQARLHLELTQSVNTTLPIAILPFSGDSSSASNGQTLTDVIRNDLQNSGQFRVASVGSGMDSSAFNSSYWRQQGIDYVLKGSVNGGQVSFQLLSVFGTEGDPNRAVMDSQTLQSNGADKRQLAHRVSDRVYQQLTGVRGIFSTKVAYVLVQRYGNGLAHYTLEVADADGFNPHRLFVSSEPIMSPAWAPDRRTLAYVSFEGHRSGIYLQDIYSGQRTLVSHYPGINGAPAFSPDGRKLALVLTSTGNPKIYTMDINSRALTPLTDGWSIDTEPRWSVDGQYLLFTSDRGGDPQIYRYDFSTHHITRITYQGNYNARASSTPDGQSVVMMHRQNGSFGIAKQDLSGGKFQILAQTGVDESPSLAPNGKMVLYATRYGNQGVLAVVSMDGRVKLRLPVPSGSVQEPAWSPFFTSAS